MGHRENEARQCQKVEWHLFHRSGRYRDQRNHEKCAGKSGIDYGISHALQGPEPPTSAGNPAAKNPTLADQNMHESWKLMNLRESIWKELCLKIMKIALQERRSIHQVITILRTSFSPSLEQRKSWMRKPLLKKSGKSSKKCQHGK